MSRHLSRRNGLAMVAILAIAALFRLGMVFNASAFILPNDTADFFGAAYDLAHDGEFSLPWKRAPLYGFFLAGVISTLGPSLERIMVVQHLLGLGTVVLTYFLGAVAFGRPIGLLAALGAGVNGSLLLMEHTIATEALYTPILTAAVLLVIAALRSGRLSLFLLAGVLLGLAALARPITQAAVPLALLLVFVQRRGWRRSFVMAGLICLGFALSVGPWVARNRVEYGAWAISGGLGDSLFARTNRHDRGFDFVDLADREADGQRPRLRKRVFELAERNSSGSTVRSKLQAEFGLTEPQSDVVLRDASLQVIRQEPQRFVIGSAQMFAALSLTFANGLDPLWYTRAEEKYARAWPERIRFVMEPLVPRSLRERVTIDRLTIFYQDRKHSVLVGILFILGSLACLVSPHRRQLIFLPIFVLTQLLLYATINGYVADDGWQARYRYPLQPIITLLCASGLVLGCTQLASYLRLRLRGSSASLNPRPGRSASSETLATE